MLPATIEIVHAIAINAQSYLEKVADSMDSDAS